MKKIFFVAGLALSLFASCKEEKTYFFIPTIGVEGRGGSGSGGDAPLQVSDTEYEIYSGSSYWGEEGKPSHYTPYTPYSEREHNYDYYRGNSEEY